MDVAGVDGSYASRLLHFLDEQRRTGLHCDVTVASNDSMIFNAHSAILAASSQLFSSKLSGQNVGQVMLDLGAKSIQMLLDVLYSGISSFQPEEVIDVRILAQSFEMEDVIKLCDGVLEYDKPLSKLSKPLMIDQSTNTEKKRPLKCVRESEVEDLESDDDGIIGDVLDKKDDPEYEPQMDLITPRKCPGRKRGRPPGRKKIVCDVTEFQEVAEAPISAQKHIGKDFIVSSSPGGEAGPRTRSRSGILKMKPELQAILTKERSTAPKIVSKIIVSKRQHKNEINDAILNFPSIDDHPVEDNLDIEEGEADDTLVEESFRSIMAGIEHLIGEKQADTELVKARKVDVDSEQFENLVTKSFSDIMKNISGKRGETGKSEETLQAEWKNCKYCSQFKGKKKGRFDFHIKYCSSDFKCAICHKPFLNKLDLSRHKCAKKQQESICELCGKTLVDRNALKLHMKIHLDIKNHACQFCGKRFIRKVHLDGHLRHVHTKERPYHCSQCSARFAMKSELTRHMYKHTTVPKYLCSCCGKAFYERSQMTYHFKICQTKHSAKYLCSHCGKQFSDQHQLVDHSRLCQAEVPVALEQTLYIERKQAPDGSMILCIVPDNSGRTVQEISIPYEEGMSDQHIIQISADDQVNVSIDEVFRNVQHFAQTGEIQDVDEEEDQVLHLQTLQPVHQDVVTYQQLSTMQDLQSLQQVQVPIMTEGVQIVQEEPMDDQSGSQTIQILQPIVSMSQVVDTGSMMEVDTMSSVQDGNTPCEPGGALVYTQSIQM